MQSARSISDLIRIHFGRKENLKVLSSNILRCHFTFSIVLHRESADNVGGPAGPKMF